MTAVTLELLDRPPETASPILDQDAVEFVAETDTLLTMCACTASSDQPYQG
jgi:hypothetical protein